MRFRAFGTSKFTPVKDNEQVIALLKAQYPLYNITENDVVFTPVEGKNFQLVAMRNKQDPLGNWAWGGTDPEYIQPIGNLFEEEAAPKFKKITG